MTNQMSKAENYESDILNEIYDEISPSELKKVEKRMLLAQKISEGIKANGWRKIDFARALNKRPSEVTKWLSGTHNFNSDTLFDIEEILGIELITTASQPKEQVITFHLSVSQRQSYLKSGLSDFRSESDNKSIYSSTPYLSLSEDYITLGEYQA
jgi:transcriptional regulator with XRE-family HTH domain